MKGLLRQWFVHGVLWAGIALCVVTVLRSLESTSRLSWDLAPVTWILLLIVPIGGWWLAVASWRRLVIEHGGDRLTWARSLRQSGLLLIGKYVPGGVFGFLARLYEVEQSGRSASMAAGVAEQLLGFIVPAALGLLLYGAARWQPWLLALVVVIPLLASGVVYVAIRMMARLPRWAFAVVLRRTKARQLIVPAILLCIQQLAWALLVWRLTRDIANAPPLDAVGVAGCFSLGVAIGMAVLIAPGGIGAREGALVVLALPWLSPGTAILIASLMRIVSIGLDLLAGSIAILLRHSNRLPPGASDAASQCRR